MSWYIFSVPGKPQGKGRPRASVVAGHARLHTPAATQLYENWIRQCWLERFQGVRLSGPVKIQGVAFFEVPKSYSKNKKLLCTQNVTPADLQARLGQHRQGIVRRAERHRLRR